MSQQPPVERQHRSLLRTIARRAMLERGLCPDFPAEALTELDGIHRPGTRNEKSMRDLRNLLWCSIDNDDSLDLETIEARPVFDGDEIKDLKADPLRFPDLSLSVSKLLGSGAMAGRAQPYGNDEMAALAKHCTEEQDAAKKVERQVTKSAAAMLLESRIGEQFDAIVTGAADKGTWIRLVDPPIEGRLTVFFGVVLALGGVGTPSCSSFITSPLRSRLPSAPWMHARRSWRLRQWRSSAVAGCGSC